MSELSRIPDPAGFVRENTRANTAPLIPEVTLHLADEMVPLWKLTEAELEATGLAPPFWAFAWAGGQAVTRYILDNPETVTGKRVLDFACGSGLGAIGAMKAGAASVLASDIDPIACSATSINAEANGVAVEVTAEDLMGRTDLPVDMILAGDICYEQPLAGHVEAWLRALAREGMLVLVGDPGRTYLPKDGIEEVATYRVQTTRELEDSDVRRTTVWRFLP
jgi:predicted nicotinamide N-methyase